MEMFLLSDNTDTLLGMRLVGVEGSIVKGKEEFEAKFNEIIKDKNKIMLLITEKLFCENRCTIIKQKISGNSPLVVEIPDRFNNPV